MRGVWLVLGIAACGFPKLPALGDDDGPMDGPGHDSPGDGAAGFVPSHLEAAMLLPNAPDVVLAQATTINTTALTIGGATNAFFVQRGPYAVLFTNAFAVQNPLTVTGSAPLIVVASDRITVTANVLANANLASPGPGALAGGTGAGLPGASFLATERESSGGGGGSYGSLGAPGGTSDPGHIAAGGTGVRYGMLVTDPLKGGSPGGAGGFSTGAIGQGGAGGGAIQLSSAAGIQIDATITVGGGGGAGGGTGFVGGGGGGSGGELFIEAPTIKISGTLAANGGGGGGGGAGGGTMAGVVGTNGTLGTGAAGGGAGGVPQGSDGGDGAAGETGSFVDATAGDGFNSKGGGGGGGAGRVWLRFRASTPPDLTNGRITPPQQIDPTLP